MADHDSIALLAYRLWEEEGRPSGRELEFWLKAEKQSGRDQVSRAPDKDATVNRGRAQAIESRPQVRFKQAEDENVADQKSEGHPDHFVVLLDRTHLHIYQLKKRESVRAQFELTESFDLPHEIQVSSEAWIDAGIPGPMEHERGLIAELSDQLRRFLEAHHDATWDYAAGPALHQPVLDCLPSTVCARLEIALVKELVHQSPAELRAHFVS